MVTIKEIKNLIDEQTKHFDVKFSAQTKELKDFTLEQVENLAVMVQGGFIEVTEKLDDHHRRFDGLEGRMGNLEGRMVNLEDRMGNIETALHVNIK